ncbi:MAG: diguanylate cyclase [Chiayiivirga sp.]|jgi:diguanylate cyclase (GGDEF)-like protein|uniref:ligand-binding sensor domain-containing diguanylate cyclase n=1 Tax=Chiayiivirga sp. TaxID=2041042 RepID=UPI0025B7DC8B|nr:ligand-binding sensor domain-containing diguanylate cyclase [Chiayiivirga sp.]MCI1710563.1 diguanylate cyclase [Chiayiivirga sp.]MCI1728606.1 diguanylate cyclase [Chiayiivirga sp.]
MGQVRSRVARALAWLLTLPLATAHGGANAAADATLRPLDLTDASVPVFSVYTGKDGLSEEIWNSVGFDHRGQVWAGSASSLARFDGYQWTSADTPRLRGLVRDLAQDPDGTLWAVIEGKGLARYDGASWQARDDVSGLLEGFSQTALQGGGFALWVGSSGQVARWRDGAFEVAPADQDASWGRVLATEITDTLLGERRQWLATEHHGLLHRRVDANGDAAGAWQEASIPGLGRFPFTDLERSIQDGKEALWIVTYGSGLFRLDADGLRVWRAGLDGLPSEAIYSALASRSPQGDTQMWFASRAGLIRMRGDEMRVFDRRHGLPSDAIRGIRIQPDVDGTDVLWIATEGGVARAPLHASPWQTVSLLGSNYNGTFALLLEPDAHGSERLWVGTAKQGLGLLQGGTWRQFNRDNGAFAAEGVRGLWNLTGPDAMPWRLAGMFGGELYRIDDALRFATLPTPWPKVDEEAVVSMLSRRHDGARELWAGTQRSGVWRLRDGRWTAFTARGASSPWGVFGFAQQPGKTAQGWLWAATDQGVARFDGQQWELLRGFGAWDAARLRHVDLHQDDGRPVLWASSVRLGVARFDVSDPRSPRLLPSAELPPPPDGTVYSALRDAAGHTYLCTNNGVQQLQRDSQGRWRDRIFRRRDGLVHDECNTNAQWIDAAGRYWAGTLGGLSVYDPALEVAPPTTRPKPFSLARIDADGRSYSDAPGQALEFPAGTREIVFRYSLLAGLNESESTYRSQLLGFDPVPGEWTSERRRSFTGLPPGSYRLRLEARDYARTAATPIDVAFELAPFWWQRGSVQWLALILLAATLLALAWLYNRRLRARQQALRKLVATRTAALHAANEELRELSYLDPLTGVANRRRLTAALDAEIQRARDLRRPLGVIVLDVDHFKRYNDEHGHIAGDVALRAVAQALSSATREQDLVARFGGEEFACLLTDADADLVSRLAERMRALVEALPPRTIGNDRHGITISLGTLSHVPGQADDAIALLDAADRALYRAKHEGRNRVRTAGGADVAAASEIGLRI